MKHFIAIDPTGWKHAVSARKPFQHMVIGRLSPYWALDNVKDAHRLAWMYSSEYFSRYHNLGCHTTIGLALRNAEHEIRRHKFIDVRILNLELRVFPEPSSSQDRERRVSHHVDDGRSNRADTTAEQPFAASGRLSRLEE